MRLKNFLSLSLLLPSVSPLSFKSKGITSGPVCSSDDGVHPDCLCHEYVDLEPICYPRLFHPTDDFHVVHPDQELPSGLHVRLNLETGLKEAKLYDGQDDASLNAVEVFSGDVEGTAATPLASPAESLPNLNFGQGGTQQVLKPSEDHGPIRPPLPNSDDSVAFTTSLSTLVSSSEASPNEDALLPALSTLEDIAHDIAYGLELSKDSKAIHKLNDFIATTSTSVQLKSAAALLLGTAIQNNPAALSAALAHFYNDEYPSGPLETVLLALVHEQIPALLSRLVYLLSELCQNQGQLIKLIRADGLDLLRFIYDAHNVGAPDGKADAARDRLRQKISDFVLDHFLMEDSLQGIRKAPRPPSDNKPGMLGKVTAPLVSKPKLEDSPWILLDPPQTPSSSPNGAPQNKKNLASTLRPWCTSFSSSLESWKKLTPSYPEKVTAEEHVGEAYDALKAKLEKYGCSFEEEGNCE